MKTNTSTCSQFFFKSCFDPEERKHYVDPGQMNGDSSAQLPTQVYNKLPDNGITSHYIKHMSIQDLLPTLPVDIDCTVTPKITFNMIKKKISSSMSVYRDVM